jgi:hypothetical protein
MSQILSAARPAPRVRIGGIDLNRAIRSPLRGESGKAIGAIRQILAQPLFSEGGHVYYGHTDHDFRSLRILSSSARAASQAGFSVLP